MAESATIFKWSDLSRGTEQEVEAKTMKQYSENTTLSAEEAEQILKASPQKSFGLSYCSLNNLKGISVPVAAILAKLPATLELNGITSLSVDVAKALAAHQRGYLSLYGLEAIDESSAQWLARHPKLATNDEIEDVIDKARKNLGIEKKKDQDADSNSGALEAYASAWESQSESEDESGEDSEDDESDKENVSLEFGDVVCVYRGNKIVEVKSNHADWLDGYCLNYDPESFLETVEECISQIDN